MNKLQRKLLWKPHKTLKMHNLRIGQGWDRHRLEKGNSLIIGGISIPSEYSCIAHSDGDVLFHALIDALLGACAAGDIGALFPPSDSKWKDIQSSQLLMLTLEALSDKQIIIQNIDATVILEKPKLRHYILEIRKNISNLLNIHLDCVSIKAKTAEKCDAVGRNEAIEAHVALLLSMTSTA